MKRRCEHFGTRTTTIKLPILGAVLVAAMSGSMACNAETGHHAFFIPDNMNYYNPLKNGREEARTWGSATGLSNEELLKAAADIRSVDMSAQQRALNHQWLASAEYSDVHVGGKVFSKLVKMGLRTYWDGVRNKHYQDNKMIPDGTGNGRVSEEVDYKIRLSDDKVKLSVRYEF